MGTILSIVSLKVIHKDFKLLINLITFRLFHICRQAKGEKEQKKFLDTSTSHKLIK